MTTATHDGTAAFADDGAALAHVFERLGEMHRDVHWHWTPESDPFEICAGAILVQNTAWTNVEHALDNLRAAGVLSVDAMSQLTMQGLEALVRPAGQFRQKARKLRAFLDLVEREGGLSALLALPAGMLRLRLLATWGIGPETADCIIAYAARKPAFVVDAYTARILSRLGHGPGETASYGAWQDYLASRLPGDAALWADYHALVVIHARDICRKRAPRCAECLLHEQCPFAARV